MVEWLANGSCLDIQFQNHWFFSSLPFLHSIFLLFYSFNSSQYDCAIVYSPSRTDMPLQDLCSDPRIFGITPSGTRNENLLSFRFRRFRKLFKPNHWISKYKVHALALWWCSKQILNSLLKKLQKWHIYIRKQLFQLLYRFCYYNPIDKRGKLNQNILISGIEEQNEHKICTFLYSS